MKKLLLIILTLLFTCGLAVTVHAAKEKFAAKAGDTIYVCACGEGCDCGTVSNKEGECGCGKEMVKTTVTKVEKGKVFYQVDGKELSAPLTGKYYCGCKKCDCNTISQKPGKCGCGKKLMKGKKS
jgi:hypothetical protein